MVQGPATHRGPGYLGLFWASSTASDDGFWSQYSFLRPSGDVSAMAHSRPQGNQVPDGSFLDATLDDPTLLEKLLGVIDRVIFGDTGGRS